MRTELPAKYTRDRRLDRIGLFVSKYSSMPSSVQRDGVIDAPRSLGFPPHVLLFQVQHWQTGHHQQKQVVRAILLQELQGIKKETLPHPAVGRPIQITA